MEANVNLGCGKYTKANSKTLPDSGGRVLKKRYFMAYSFIYKWFYGLLPAKSREPQEPVTIQ